jgi:predicted RecA/RadA family phage recombinase
MTYDEGGKVRMLVHDEGDDVAIVLIDIAAGTDCTGSVVRTGAPIAPVRAVDDIPFGNKIALRKIPAQAQVIEYGAPIGVATQDIAPGAHVHVHNLRSGRW